MKTLMASGLLIATTALLSGCGFTPLYATNSKTSVATALRSVALSGISGPPEAQRWLGDALERRLPNSESGGRYALAIELRESRRAVAASRSADNTRFNYTLRADYVLTDRTTGEERRRNLDTVVGFGVVESQYSSLIASDDAVRRAANDLARKIEFDIVLYLSGRGDDSGSVVLPEELRDEIGDDIRYNQGTE